MARVGIYCPPIPGHLHPGLSLGRALVARGHEVICFNLADGAARIEAAGLPMHLVGLEVFPLGRLSEELLTLGQLTGLAQYRFTLKLIVESALMALDELPDALRAQEIDLLLVDESSPGGGTVAEALGLPWVTVAAALTWQPDLLVAPPMLPDGPARSWWQRLRNRAINLVSSVLMWPAVRVLNRGRRELGLEPVRAPYDEFSPRLHLHALPEVLAFPRAIRRPGVHHVGPLVDARARAEVPFPWERLDGRPLVYASMGTVQNLVIDTFRRISTAAEGLDCQLVISLGGGADTGVLSDLPGDPLVVGYAPQLDLLERTTVFVSHAGMNSALESMRAGVPMVMLPVGNDQPGVAARVHHAGAGISLGSSKVSAPQIRTALQAVLSEPRYGERARAIAAEMAKVDSLELACTLIEAELAS